MAIFQVSQRGRVFNMFTCILCGKPCTAICCNLCSAELLTKMNAYASQKPICYICGSDQAIINSLGGSTLNYICRPCDNFQKQQKAKASQQYNNICNRCLYTITANMPEYKTPNGSILCSPCFILWSKQRQQVNNFNPSRMPKPSSKGCPYCLGRHYNHHCYYCGSTICQHSYQSPSQSQNQQIPTPLPYYQRAQDMLKVEVTHRPDIDAYDLHFPMPGRYGWDQVKGLIDVIKATIPASDRTYDTITKTWTLLSERYISFQSVLKSANVQIITKAETRTKPISQQDFFYSYKDPVSSSKETKESLMDKLKRLLGCSDADFTDSVKLKQLYRRKALEFHPDRNNGDGSRMSELNSIWSAYNA